MSEKMLISTEQIKPLEIFVEGKYDGLLDFIKKESEISEPTVKTKKGRDLIRSTARKIASSRVFIEKARKELSDAERAKIDKTLSAILESGNFIGDALTYHQAIVREPLTKYEAEKKAEEEFQLLQNQILECHIEALEHNQFLIDKKAVDDEKKRLENERIKMEIEQKAKEKAEQEQRDVKEAETRKRIQAEQEAERLKQKAINDANQAEIDKENAVRLAEQKAADEAKRIENERLQKEKQEQALNKARETDTAHRKKINNESLEDLVKILVGKVSMTNPEKICQEVIIAIAKKQIRNVSINY